MAAKKETGFAALREEIKKRPKKTIFNASPSLTPPKVMKKGLAPGEPCPVCGHDLIGHYGMINKETGDLVDPYPAECSEGCGCRYGFIRGTEGI
jgi:hypothetical protein